MNGASCLFAFFAVLRGFKNDMLLPRTLGPVMVGEKEEKHEKTNSLQVSKCSMAYVCKCSQSHSNNPRKCSRMSEFRVKSMNNSVRVMNNEHNVWNEDNSHLHRLMVSPLAASMPYDPQGALFSGGFMTSVSLHVVFLHAGWSIRQTTATSNV